MKLGTYTATIISVEERFRTVCESGFGDTAVMRKESRGWFIVLDDFISYAVGEEKPACSTKQAVTVTLETTDGSTGRTGDGG